MLDPNLPTLNLIQEHKIHEIFGTRIDERFEASGVCAHEGSFYVIFDNLPHTGRLNMALTPGGPEHVLYRQRGDDIGYEDITLNERERRFYLLIEAVPFAPGVFKAKIDEYDMDFRWLESHWLDFPLEVENKGLEGLTWLQRGDQDYVLAVCEGNKCKGGALGRKPGGGRIQIFQKGPGQWERVGKLKLPKTLLFEDYSGLDVVEDRLAVVSQQSSAVWVGQLTPDAWQLVDEGSVYLFPRDAKGNSLYCNIEGVSWIDARQIVVVSDKAKPGTQPKKCAQKDQSIHVFSLPEGAP